jgi:AcrR family transcriptional regulator
MTTRETIINMADQYIRHKGFNAFSFKDISGNIGIKTASIHYHFPTKTDLCVATIKTHIDRFETFKQETEHLSAPDRLQAFLSIYSAIRSENKVCLVGSLATDLNTVDDTIRKELGVFAGLVLDWMTAVLEQGRSETVFAFNGLARL